MAKKRLTDPSIPAITSIDLADLMHIVDVSDTTSHPLGTSKKMSINQLMALITSNIDTFLELTDTPANYTGSALKYVRVNSGETGLEFATIDLSNYQLTSEKGAANGYAPLNGSTKIDSLYLPSYVDDVLEYANLASFPVSGETGKIYVDVATGLIYRWSGSIYVEISPSSIPTISQVATAGNVLNTTQTIGFKDGDNTYTTYISNEQSIGGNRTVYLPTLGANTTGQLAYHANGVPLSTNYVLKGGANGIVQSSVLIFENGSNVGININSGFSSLFQIKGTSNALADYSLIVKNLAGTKGIELNNEGALALYGGLGISGGTNTTAQRLNIDDNSSNIILRVNGDNGSTEFGLGATNFGRLRVYKQGDHGIQVGVNNTDNEYSAFSVYDGSNFRVRIDKSGNASFGFISSPQARLHVSSTSGTALRIDGSLTNNNLVVLDGGTMQHMNGNFQFTQDVGYATLRSTIYQAVRFGTHAVPDRIVLERDGNISLNDRTYIKGAAIPSVTETLSVGFSNHSVNGNVSSMVVDNITMGASNSGLGLFAIGRFGSGGTTGNATLNFSYTPTSYGGTVNSSNNNYFRVGLGIGGVVDYRLNVSGGIRIESDIYTTSSAVLELSSTTQGFLPPRMSGSQAESITSPAVGLLVYANNGNGTTITSIGWWGYDGSAWNKLN
jgi:hypothetical protein